jgi:F0F1-type ATP synthase assembly protein I
MLKKKDHFIIAGLGIEFALIMCAGFFGGIWLDRRFNTAPWLLLAGCAAAFAVAMYILVKSARAAVDAGQEASASEPAPEGKKW